MKPVKENLDVCLPLIRHGLPLIRQRLPNRPIGFRIVCFYLRHMNADIKAQLQKVDGMEVLDVAPAGSAEFLRGFYTDQIGQLVKAARELDVRSKYLIAPALNGEGFSIFTKPAKGAR